LDGAATTAQHSQTAIFNAAPNQNAAVAGTGAGIWMSGGRRRRIQRQSPVLTGNGVFDVVESHRPH
jgi:hypothetical protein